MAHVLCLITLADCFTSPGAVETDMGTSGAAAYGISLKDMGGITATQSAQGILSVVDAATKETHGGKFWSYNGDEMTY